MYITSTDRNCNINCWCIYLQ